MRMASVGRSAPRWTGVGIIADLVRIIYVSTPFGYDEGMLNGILLDARRCNARDGITGALVCRRDAYLQLLEGPTGSVAAAFARIRRDDRHLDVRTLVERTVPERAFGAWSMLHDPATSWLWSEDEIAGGALDRATEAEVESLFTGLARTVATDG